MMVSQNQGSTPATTSTPAIVTGRSVTALRWYMRIAGALLFLFMLLPGDPESSTLFSFIANHGPYLVPAGASIIGSFGKRVNWLLGVVLTLIWGVLAVNSLFGGPNGPGLVFEIAGSVIVVAGLVVVALSFGAFTRDF